MRNTLDLPSGRGTFEAFAATVYETKRPGSRKAPTYAGEVQTDGSWVLSVEGRPGKWRVIGYRSALLEIANLAENVTIVPSEGALRALDAAVDVLRRSLDK